MNTCSCIGISTMKPCCKILISCRNSSIFGFPYPKCNHLVADNLSKSQLKANSLRRFHTCNNKILGFRCVIDLNRRAFCVSDLSWGQSRVLTSQGVDKSKRVSVIANVASDFKNHSTSVETHINEKGFERIYIQVPM
ncbi:hypothetical protein CsSME_00033000 [Camellia sinensis var. sinensis]